MSFVKPFCGTRYNPKKITNPADVASWPHDCITPEGQDEFYRQNEYNIIRLIKAKISPMDSGTDNIYTRASADLLHWLDSGVLVTDPAPAFYYYRIGYTNADGATLLRKGFIGLMRLDDDKVLPHEKISQSSLNDRLALSKATGANLTPIFTTYQDPNRSVLSLMAGSLPSDPIIKTIFIDNTEHAIWRITDENICDEISKAMEQRKVMIADGHHRYAAALKFRDIAREKFPDAGPDAPFEYILTYFSPSEDEGITILPTHRAVTGLKNISIDDILMKLSKTFYIKEHPIDSESPEKSLADAIAEADELNEKDETFIMGINGADSLFLLNFKKDQAKSSYPTDVPPTVRSLDVSILQQVIFENVLGIETSNSAQSTEVSFFCDAKEIYQRMADGAQLVFIMNPTRMETLWTVAKAGRLLPTKSSYFYPKVLAGFVLHKF